MLGTCVYFYSTSYYSCLPKSLQVHKVISYLHSRPPPHILQSTLFVISKLRTKHKLIPPTTLARREGSRSRRKLRATYLKSTRSMSGVFPGILAAYFRVIRNKVWASWSWCSRETYQISDAWGGFFSCSSLPGNGCFGYLERDPGWTRTKRSGCLRKTARLRRGFSQ